MEFPITVILSTLRQPNTIWVLSLSFHKSGNDVAAAQDIGWIHKTKSMLIGHGGERQLIKTIIVSSCMTLCYLQLLIPLHPQKFQSPGVVIQHPCTYIYNIGMIDAENLCIKKEVRSWCIHSTIDYIWVIVREEHDITVLCARIYDILSPPDIVSGVVELN